MKLNLINLKLFGLLSLLLAGLWFDSSAAQDLSKVSHAISAKKTKKPVSYPKKSKKSKVQKIPDIIKKPEIKKNTEIIANQELILQELILDDIPGLELGIVTPGAQAASILPVSSIVAQAKIAEPVESEKSAVPENLVAPAVPNKGAKKRKQRESMLKKHILLAKNFNDLNDDELAARVKEHLASGDFRSAAICMEREIAICKNHNVMCKLRLERADAWLAAQEIEKAAAAYREFIAQYPSHSQTEYAKYKLIKILFDAMPVCDRDQSGTREALQTAQDFLANTAYVKYRAEVEKISKRCNCQLFDSEVKIFEYYVNHNKYVAARKRLSSLEKLYPEFTVELAELHKWLKSAEDGTYYALPEDMRVRRAKKHDYSSKKRNYGAMF